MEAYYDEFWVRARPHIADKFITKEAFIAKLKLVEGNPDLFSDFMTGILKKNKPFSMKHYTEKVKPRSSKTHLRLQNKLLERTKIDLAC